MKVVWQCFRGFRTAFGTFILCMIKSIGREGQSGYLGGTTTRPLRGTEGEERDGVRYNDGSWQYFR